MAVHARANGREDLRFIAFEPSRRKCKFIRSVVRANGLEDSVRIVNACVGDVSRKVTQVDERGFDRYDGRIAYNSEPEMEKQNEDLNGQTCQIRDSSSTSNSSSPFYFDSQMQDGGNESSSESDSSDDEDNNDKGIAMISLDSMKNEINPLGLLHLDVEGWEARALHGANEILSEIKDTCYIVCEVWDEKDRKKRHKAVVDAEGKPGDAVLAAIEAYSQFERLDDIVDQDRNLFFRCQSIVEKEND